MSNKWLDIGNQGLWLLGHALFTLITVCAVRGGYVYWTDWKSVTAIDNQSIVYKMDVSELSEEDRMMLSNELVKAGTSVPRPGRPLNQR